MKRRKKSTGKVKVKKKKKKVDLKVNTKNPVLITQKRRQHMSPESTVT